MKRSASPANNSWQKESRDAKRFEPSGNRARPLPCMQGELGLLEPDVIEGARNMVKRLVRMCVEELDRGWNSGNYLDAREHLYWIFDRLGRPGAQENVIYFIEALQSRHTETALRALQGLIMIGEAALPGLMGLRSRHHPLSREVGIAIRRIRKDRRTARLAYLKNRMYNRHRQTSAAPV